MEVGRVLMLYTLEVESYGEWEYVDSYLTLSAAIEFGKSDYSHNAWRIVCEGCVEHVHDPITAFMEESEEHLYNCKYVSDWIRGQQELREFRDQEREREEREREAALNWYPFELDEERTGFENFEPVLDNHFFEDKPEKVDWTVEGF